MAEHEHEHERDGWIENPIPWPGGARCAASITFDVDLDSMLRLTYGPRTPERMATLSWLGYEHVAVPRIARLYEERGIEQTFFFPGYCMDSYPELVEGVLAHGHEVGLHGYLHEVSFEQDPGQEAEILDKALDAARRLMGRTPTGWRAPLYGLSDRSPELLLEHGFVYDASLMGDDQPYLLRTPRGDLIELPSEWANDDWPHYAHVPDLDYAMPVKAPRDAVAAYRAEFEAAYRHGGLWVGVFHPSISGRLARLATVVDLLDVMLERGDVWIAPLSEIAAHVQRLIAAGDWKPRVVAVERVETAVEAEGR
jgi:peptidoglycan/xylan/chitin deacetylase (PgdA/CDA1 family)